MEHEDNAHLDNYLQNSQHLMENLQMASGGGVRGGDVGAEEIGIGLGIGNIGGKFEEHEEQDDEEEWKYIKEVQQSEKQQTKVIDGKEVVEGVGNSNSNGNGNIDAGDEMLLLGRHEYEAGDGFGNGVADVAVAAHAAGDGFRVAVGSGDHVDGDEEGEVEIIKNDGDFSTTSNTTSTPGEEDAGAVGVLQVEMKIETAEQMPQLQSERMAAAFGAEETEEEEPSSLATNTTNGTNSLSENVPPQQLHELPHEEHEQREQEEQHEQQQQHDYNFDIENKENADPLLSEQSAAHATDFEMHSQLNPDAREFVPSFGSNPASPTLPVSSNPFDAEHVGEPAVTQAELLQPHPSVVARHLLGDAGDDDFVALSPRKGRGETDMEGIALPPENEFEHEAAKRPHELEQDLTAGAPLQPPLLSEAPLGHLDNFGGESAMNLLGTPDTTVSATEDALDFQRQSPASFIDHGPETCVDLDADIDEQPLEALKQTELAEKPGESIEQLLNTVQPLPTDSDSLNASFTDEGQQEPVVGEKELLDVDEKEHISHSPSTEEMQMNLEFQLHASAKDIPQIPTDLDNVEHMQDSIYLEHTSSDAQQQKDLESEPEKELHSPEPQPQPQSPAPQSPQPQTQSQLTDESLLIDTSIPIESDVSFEAMRAAPAIDEVEPEAVVAAPQTALNIFAPEFTPIQKLTVDATPSPQSTEEKHLVEKTKEEEQAAATNVTEGLDEFEQKMDDLILSAKDGILSQVEKVAETATHIFDNSNPFATQESEYNAAEFMTEEPQLTPTFVPEVKAIIPEPELVACQYAALNEQVAEAVKTAADDAFAPTEAEPTKEAFVEEPIPAVEPPVSAAVEKPIAAEPTTAPAVELAAEPVSEPAFVEPAVVAEEKPTVKDTEVVVGAIAATAAAAAATAATVALTKKADSAKKPASRAATTAKPKLGDVKKAAPAKKPVTAATTTAKTTTTNTTAARPRTAPIHKPATTAVAEKKAPITARTSTTTTTRKPLTASSTTTTTRTTTTRTTTTRPATAPAAASKTASTPRPTTTARRSETSAPKSFGSAAKPGTTTTSSAPTKPTTLGLSGTTKPRLSPRATLTSQLRKTVPGATTTSTARSPSKGTTPTTNGTHTVAKSSTTTAASRAKSTPVSTTTTTTKTFTARPAPRTTLSTTTTTRRTVGGTPNTTTTTKTSSTLLKRTPTSKTGGTTSGRLSLSPTKTPTTALKTKTKEATKKATPSKTGAAASVLKQKQKEEKTNGAGELEVQKDKEQQPQLNGDGESHMVGGHLENGTHIEGEQNGGALDQGFLVEPQQQQQAPAEFGLIDA